MKSFGVTEAKCLLSTDDEAYTYNRHVNHIPPVQILVDKPVSPQVFAILRKMKPIRQIEAAEHMVAGGTYTIPFAKALLAVTKPEMLEADPTTSSKKLQATSMAARSMLEEENDSLLKNLKSVEESYGTDVLALTVSCGYIDRLLQNPKVTRYLNRNHTDILRTLQQLLSDTGRRPADSENGNG